MSSTKNSTNIIMRQMPSAQSYSVMRPVRHGFVSESTAGAKSCLDVRYQDLAHHLADTYMNKRRRNDNSGTKVLGKKECIFHVLVFRSSPCEYREDSA